MQHEPIAIEMWKLTIYKFNKQQLEHSQHLMAYDQKINKEKARTIN